MKLRHVLTAILALFLALPAARAAPPPDRLAVLRRGISLTNWFRYPPSADAASVRAYMSDAAIADLRRAGFTFVRLPVQPEFLFAATEQRLALLEEAIGRLQRAGLGVVIDVHPATWHLETAPADRDRLANTWRSLAPFLARFDPRLTFPEIVNEPVFAKDSAQWEALQRRMIGVIRADLPKDTIVLTGNDWGSLDGLSRLVPVEDGNVVYSFHFYEPRTLVLLADWRPTLDKTALATLPFPVADPCIRAPASGDTLGTMRFYCGERWDLGKLYARLAQAAEWAARTHEAVVMGEFGALHALNPGARLTWLRAVREDAEAFGFGWALWGYDDVMGFNIPRPPGPRPTLDPKLLQALGLRSPP